MLSSIVIAIFEAAIFITSGMMLYHTNTVFKHILKAKPLQKNNHNLEISGDVPISLT
jgi:hypothetical protein